MKIKSLTIYCSSSQKLNKKFYKMARETAEIISNYKIKVIYGGGNIGLMGEIARTLISLNNEVIGIIPKFLIKKEKLNLKLTSLKIVSNMSKRKEKLFKLGDAFLILPGGTGTLEEIVEVVSWKIMGIHNKPIIFFNKNNFWHNLFQQFKFFEDEKFSNKNLQNSFHIIDTVDQLKNLLIKWQK